MAPDKLSPTDSRVTHHKATLRGKTYHYLLAKPSGPYKATIILVHGWPDLSLGWRYQVPFLTTLGLQVVVPDMLGYGQTDSPDDLAAFSLKSMSADLADLAAQLAPGEPILLGGHDWGGMLVWRMAQWHPALVRAVFSVCTPYSPPSPVPVDLARLGELLPNFRYQQQLAGPDVVREVSGAARLRQFLNGMYGGRGPAGEVVFNNRVGVLFENLDRVGASPLLSAAEADFYVEQYARNGMRGPTNWYRTRAINFEEEKELLKESTPRIRAPSLMASAADDSTLPPSLTEGMEKHFDNLTKKIVKGHHWCLWESPQEVNDVLGEWLTGVLKAETPKASI